MFLTKKKGVVGINYVFKDFNNGDEKKKSDFICICLIHGNNAVLAFSKDGLLATGGVGTTVSIYDVTSETKVHEFKLDHGACSVSFSPGGSLLAIGEYGENISKIRQRLG